MALFGCGGSGTSGASQSGAPLPDMRAGVWDPSPWMWFIAGQTRAVDLALTLPEEAARGGVFGLASGSAALPPGFVLSPAGMLSATDPVASQTANIVFTYAEPA